MSYQLTATSPVVWSTAMAGKYWVAPTVPAEGSSLTRTGVLQVVPLSSEKMYEDVGVVVSGGRNTGPVGVDHVDAAVMHAAAVVVGEVGLGVDGAAAHVERARLGRDRGGTAYVGTRGP